MVQKTPDISLYSSLRSTQSISNYCCSVLSLSLIRMTKHKSPSKKIRSMKRLLTFMLSKLKQLSSPSSKICSSSDQQVKPSNSFTLNDFLKVSRSITQEHEEIRRKEREKDLRNFETLLEAYPGFPLPHI